MAPEATLFAIAFFVLGTVLASFVGLWASRAMTGASIVTGRSLCDACGAVLPPHMLVPILSWIISQGRCFSCKSRIGASSTLAEALLGVLFAAAYLKLGATLALPLILLAFALLLALVLYDLAHTILPPLPLSAFVAVSLSVALVASPNLTALALSFFTALLIASFLALVHLASGGRAMGLADAPLAFGLSLIAGPLAFSGLLYSFWIGGAVGIILLVRRARGSKIQSEVPFAPYLAAGFLLAYFTSWDALTLTQGLLLLDA